MSDRIRTFVAIELDEELRRSLMKLQDEVKADLDAMMSSRGQDRAVRIQWTRPESLHLTLKFLGDIDPSQVEVIRQALTDIVAARNAFSLEVEGCGAFPDARSPRTLWVGLKTSPQHDPLLGLAAEMERALSLQGFPPEAKAFTPHLTLARIKDGARFVGQALQASGRINTIGRVGTLRVEDVALMKSELRPTGSLYTRLFEVSLNK
jgi:RNA 2',3'-cyclic 3'-phosphodiesterase